jgi:hypothetical protein
MMKEAAKRGGIWRCHISPKHRFTFNGLHGTVRVYQGDKTLERSLDSASRHYARHF